MNVETDLNYAAVVEALIEKTRKGKIHWQETADEDTFIAAVKGKQVFEIALEQHPGVFGANFSPRQIAVLRVRDGNEKLLFQTSQDEGELGLDELFRLARRIAVREDEQIESTLQLLKQL